MPNRVYQQIKQRQVGAPFTQNVGGLREDRVERYIPMDSAVKIENMHKTSDGVWSADNAGYLTINSGGTAYESGAGIDGVFQYINSSHAVSLIIACNAKLKSINTSTGVDTNIDTSTGFTAGALVDGAQIAYNFYTCDGNAATPRKWNGTAASAASGWPISDGTNTYATPNLVERFGDRMAFACFDTGTGGPWPSHVILSDYGNAESFTLPALYGTNAAVLEVSPGDGQKITGMRELLDPITNTSKLIVTKERSTYIITGTSADPASNDTFKVLRVNPNFGAVNNRSVVRVGNDFLALGPYGIYSITISEQSGTIYPMGIASADVETTLSEMNYTQREKCWALHLPDRREVLFGLPTGASTKVDKVLVYKYPNPGDAEGKAAWSVRTSGGVFYPSHAVQLPNKEVYVGLDGGFVGRLFGAPNYNGVGIPWRYKWAATDFGDETLLKSVRTCSLFGKVRSTQNITVSTRWIGGNNNDSVQQSVVFASNTSEAEYGAGVYGASYYGSQVDTKVMFPILGNGQRLSVEISGTTTATGPEIHGLLPLVTVGGRFHGWN